MKVPREVLDRLRSGRGFLIATHINPDGDALGSALALSFALESLGKQTVLYERDGVPEPYRFLPGRERFTDSAALSGLPLVLLDCNEPERAGLSRSDLDVPYSLVIDHHETERGFGDLRWIEPKAAATGIMVYHLLRELGVTITGEIATNLYVAIAIDTGTFRYSNTDPEVLRVCADLIEAGADPASISVALYESWSGKRFCLLLSVLNTLEIVDGIAITHVTREMFSATGTSAEDTEHFSNFPRMMGAITASAFFREIDEGWKVSLRSKGTVNVAKVAEKFDGGGHRNAAGFKTRADLKAAKEALIAAMRDP